MNDPAMRRRYRKKPSEYVIAVQIALDTPGFAYRKWGGEQRCKRGDWLVDNHGDVYTVDGEVFARTYRQVAPGRFVKCTPVWAERAQEAGAVDTKEGRSHYAPGDYLVFNDEAGTDGWCVTAATFDSMYESDEEPEARD
jgi:hypothetical protein